MSRPLVAVTDFRTASVRTVAVLLATLMTATVMLAMASPVRAVGGDGLRDAANRYRTDGGLPAVVGTALLDDIATRRAARMASENVLEHDMDYVASRLDGAGVCWSGLGEIIAWERGYPDYDYARTMLMWWNSPSHHDVMMGRDYNAAGGAWDTAADGGHYSVMVFVTLCGSSIASEPSGVLYPDDRYDPDRQLVLEDGRVTAYRLDRSGDVRSEKSIRLARTLRVDSGGRARANGRAWLKVSSGALAGYWVRETSTTFVRGLTEKRTFSSEQPIRLEAGHYVGHHFDRLGRITAGHRSFFGHGREFSASALGIINGRRYYMVSSGPLAGFWLRDTPAVHAL